MGTPSEVFAGRVLDDILKLDEVKFVDRTYDYEARNKKHKYVAEVKLNILPLHQMEALAKKYSEGVKALLLVVDNNENYCLFELTSTNLAPPPSPSITVPKEIVVPKSLANILSEKMNLEPKEAVRRAISNFRVLMTAPLHKVIDVESLKRLEKIERERME